jgi:hypothetical protein
MAAAAHGTDDWSQMTDYQILAVASGVVSARRCVATGGLTPRRSPKSAGAPQYVHPQ